MARMRDAAAAGLILAAAVLAGALLSTPLSHAAGEPEFGCKKIHRGKAEIDPNPKGRAPVAIGDSTMILPIPNLDAVGYSVNARGCRGFREAVNIARKLKAKHHLPHLVMINAYGNGGVNPGLISEALRCAGQEAGAGAGHRLQRGHRRAARSRHRHPLQGGRQYPHRIFVLDWVKYSRPHHTAEPTPGAWFLPDLFHPNFTGADAYAQFLAQALPHGAAGQLSLGAASAVFGRPGRAANGISFFSRRANAFAPPKVRCSPSGWNQLAVAGAVVDPVEHLDVLGVALARVADHPARRSTPRRPARAA